MPSLKEAAPMSTRVVVGASEAAADSATTSGRRTSTFSRGVITPFAVPSSGREMSFCGACAASVATLLMGALGPVGVILFSVLFATVLFDLFLEAAFFAILPPIRDGYSRQQLHSQHA